MADDTTNDNVLDFRAIAEAKVLDQKPAESLEEYASQRWDACIEKIEGIEAGDELGLNRNSRFHLAVCEMASFISPPWDRWDAARIIQAVSPLARERRVTGWEATLDSAIAFGKEHPHKVPERLQRRIRRAVNHELPKLQNFHWEEDEKGDVKKAQKSVKEVVDDIHMNYGDWPRAVGPTPFTREGDETLFLDSVAKLESWLAGRFQVEWVAQTKGLKASSMSTLLASLAMYAKHKYIAIDKYPHYPPIKDVYYTETLQDGDGKTLEAFLNLLNPATQIDRVAMKALLMILAWGGDPGTRIAALFTSDYGKGVGKTATAEVFCDLFGGSIDVDLSSERPDRIKERLLTTESYCYRIVLCDNVKGKVNISSIESLITSRNISGRKMYVGDSKRPNYLTFILTANSPNLSSDLANRCLPIKIGPKKHHVDFRSEVKPYLPGGELYVRLLGDIQAALKGPSVCKPKPIRFSDCSKAVFSKLKDGELLVEEMLKRQIEYDDDAEETLEIADILIEWEQNGLPNTRLVDGRVFMPAKSMPHQFSPLWPDCRSAQEIRQRLAPFLGQGALKNVDHKARPRIEGKKCRGLAWTPISTKK